MKLKLGRLSASIYAIALAFTPYAALADTPPGSPGSGCGSWATGFQEAQQGINAFQQFFYGPVFKVGALIIFALIGLTLLADDGRMPQWALWGLRIILLIALVGAAASWLNIGGPVCS